MAQVGGYLGMGGISRGVRGISQGVGQFHRSTRHPIWPLSNSDSVYFRIVLHLRRELTDPPSRVAAGVGGQVQYRWHGLPRPGARISRHTRGGDQDGIRQVTRAWHAGIPSWQGAHASIPHMPLTTTCLSQGMPWMPPGRGIWEITSPLLPSWLPITRPLFPPRLWISGAISPLWLSGHYLPA